MKEHAITVLGNIRGHSKVLKMVSGNSSRWGDIEGIEAQIMVIP